MLQVCNLKGVKHGIWSLVYILGKVLFFKLDLQTEIADAARKELCSRVDKNRPGLLLQLKSNDDYGIRHQCSALIILRDIYLTPQRSCLASRRKSPINGGNNRHFLCTGGRGETGKITEITGNGI